VSGLGRQGFIFNPGLSAGGRIRSSKFGAPTGRLQVGKMILRSGCGEFREPGDVCASANGTQIAAESNARATIWDTGDINTSDYAQEIFRYRLAAARSACKLCNACTLTSPRCRAAIPSAAARAAEIVVIVGIRAVTAARRMAFSSKNGSTP
jgi:hypothetical protein